MGVSFWQIAITLALLIVPIGVALWLDRRNRAQGKYELPYRWGYFVGVGAILSGLPVLFFLSDFPSPSREYMMFGQAIYIAGALGVLMRATWGWIAVFASYGLTLLGGALGLAPGSIGGNVGLVVLAVINGIYASKRWREMKGDDAAAIGEGEG